MLSLVLSCCIKLLLSIDFGMMCHRIIQSFRFSMCTSPSSHWCCTAASLLSHCVLYYTANTAMNFKTMGRSHLKSFESLIFLCAFLPLWTRNRSVGEASQFFNNCQEATGIQATWINAFLRLWYLQSWLKSEWTSVIK